MALNIFAQKCNQDSSDDLEKHSIEDY
jgi:hypothetical protein